MLSQAIARGVRFEICYAPGILASESSARRNLISNVVQLIRATRGRGLVISSEAKTALGCRAPSDVINLTAVWGLGQERGKEAICKEARSTIVCAQLKRTSYRGVIDFVYGGEKSETATPKQSQGKGEAQKKRKAGAITTNAAGEGGVESQNPLSNRELKRQEKRARLEAQKNITPSTNPSTKDTGLNGWCIYYKRSCTNGRLNHMSSLKILWVLCWTKTKTRKTPYLTTSVFLLQ